VNCLCGCGTKLGRSQVEINMVAGEVAIELVVWDKARALRSPVSATEVAELLADGALHYQRLLAAIHAGEGVEEGELEDTREWLERSRGARQRLSGRLPVPKKKITLSAAEQAQIDRVHPERTFSGGGAEAPRSAAAPAPEEPAGMPTALELELGSALAAGRGGGEDYERLAVAWLGRLVAEQPPSLDELRWLLGRLEDVRSGRGEEAEPALRGFLSERS
jgi:hypothetical protein